MPATSREEHKARFTRELINVVNPRLVLYTHAGILAVVILLLNYSVVAALASVLMQFCTEVTTVEHSEPSSRGDQLVHIGFINRTLEREGVVGSGAITVTTSVAGCAKRNTATIVAPHPQAWRGKRSIPAPCVDKLETCVDLANSGSCRTNPMGMSVDCPKSCHYCPTVYGAYEGTGITVEVPCWNSALPCTVGTTWEDKEQGWKQDCTYDSPCTYQEWYVSKENLPCGWYHLSGDYGGEAYGMASKADRFPWCTEKEEEDAHTAVWDNMNLTSQLFGGESVDMGRFCGDSSNVYPGGVTTPSISAVPTITNYGSEPLYTTHWDLRVTTTTKTCPSFSAAFANAFAYAAQIEIVITLVLIFVFKKVRMISDVQGMIDIGAAGIITAEKAAELRDAGKDTTAVV